MTVIKFFMDGFNQVKKTRKDEAKEILACLTKENPEDAKEILATLNK